MYVKQDGKKLQVFGLGVFQCVYSMYMRTSSCAALVLYICRLFHLIDTSVKCFPFAKKKKLTYSHEKIIFFSSFFMKSFEITIKY